jgi:hypothetical protein
MIYVQEAACGHVRCRSMMRLSPKRQGIIRDKAT